MDDGAVVTRGDFIRAAVRVLDIREDGSTPTTLPYARIPKALNRFVRIAEGRRALGHFGDELLTARGITRGEALQVIVELLGARTDRESDFSDVQTAGEKRAVGVAVENHWMDPLRGQLFGTRRLLTGGEAKVLLRKVSGEGGGEAAPEDGTAAPVTKTIRINVQTLSRVQSFPKSQILEAIWGLILQEYLYEDKINPDEAAYAAIEGIIKSLGDQYTSFLRPIDSRSFQSQISGHVTGIGAQVEYQGGILTVVTPLKGSPAERAGLLPGDQILKADGVDLRDIGFLEAVEKVRGERGTSVRLTIRRNGAEFVADVVRDTVTVPEVTISWQGNVAVVEITQFGRLTLERLWDQLVEIRDRKPRGIVLDLRNNPGGLLSAATSVVGHFVPRGSPVVKIRARELERTDVTLHEPAFGDDVPLVVLVNEGSASASEIVAGALQDLKRATIVGTKTFGKGTVQQVLQFNDQSSLKMTIAEWFTPNGNKIDGKGIQPDVFVESGDGRDLQMVKALDLLR